MNKYQSKINKAKSMKVLKDIASHIGVGIGNIKDIVKAKARLTNALAKQQAEIKTEMEGIRTNRKNNLIDRNYKRVSEAEKRYLKSFKNASPLEREVFTNNKTATFLDNIKIGSPLYFHNFKTKAEFNNFIKTIRPENRSQFIKDYINSLDLNNYKRISPRVTKLFNKKVSDVYEVGGLSSKVMKEHNHLTDMFNSVDYVRQMEMIELMDSAEYASMIESLTQKGYSEPLAVEIALNALGYRSDNVYRIM